MQKSHVVITPQKYLPFSILLGGDAYSSNNSNCQVYGTKIGSETQRGKVVRQDGGERRLDSERDRREIQWLINGTTVSCVVSLVEG